MWFSSFAEDFLFCYKLCSLHPLAKLLKNYENMSLGLFSLLLSELNEELEMMM